MDKKVRITGFGGQGVITAGFILGQAASIFDEINSIFTQAYGPEARGSACSAQIVISKTKILNPIIDIQDILVAMSQEGYDKYIAQSLKNSIVIIDEDLVEIGENNSALKIYPIPATRLAEKEIGKRIVTNIIMLGFLTSVTGVVSETAISKAVSERAPRGTEEINEKALKLGLHYKPKKLKLKSAAN